ncbi:MAG: methylated-DNA--[protein]-cysteine S-methyltransferase [Actinomycetes bacterium]
MSLEQRLTQFDPAVRPPALPDGDVSYTVDDTGVGRMLLAVRADGAVVASSFAPDAAAEDAVLTRIAARVSPRVLRKAAPTDALRRQLEEFLTGRRRDFDLRTDLALAGDFQRSVLTRLAATVPYGARTTYGALAADLGRPTASRAVGAALGANPLCVVLPCHRVVAASGALTGYAGGLAVKERLLTLESPPSPGGQSEAWARR